MQLSGFDELRQAVQALRADKYPTLPPDLVDAILEIEAEHVEDRGPAPRKVERLVDVYVSEGQPG
jgi:hypothetical protein